MKTPSLVAACWLQGNACVTSPPPSSIIQFRRNALTKNTFSHGGLHMVAPCFGRLANALRCGAYHGTTSALFRARFVGWHVRVWIRNAASFGNPAFGRRLANCLRITAAGSRAKIASRARPCSLENTNSKIFLSSFSFQITAWVCKFQFHEDLRHLMHV